MLSIINVIDEIYKHCDLLKIKMFKIVIKINSSNNYE